MQINSIIEVIQELLQKSGTIHKRFDIKVVVDKHDGNAWKKKVYDIPQVGAKPEDAGANTARELQVLGFTGALLQRNNKKWNRNVTTAGSNF